MPTPHRRPEAAPWLCLQPAARLRERANAGAELAAGQPQPIQAGQLENPGQLGAGIVHQIRNSLGVLSMGVEYLTGDLEAAGQAADPAVAEILLSMRESVRRIDTLLLETLDLSAPRPLERRPEDLNNLIVHTLPLVRHEFDAAGIHVQVHLQRDLPALTLDGSKLQQVLIHLFTHAAQAVSDHSPAQVAAARGDNANSRHELTIRTLARSLREEEQAANLRQDEDRRCLERCEAGDPVVILEIEATGTGWAERAGVFDPFFTTAEASREGADVRWTVTGPVLELCGGEMRLETSRDGWRGSRVTTIFKVPAVSLTTLWTPDA